MFRTEVAAKVVSTQVETAELLAGNSNLHRNLVLAVAVREPRSHSTILRKYMDYGPLNMHLRNFVSAHNALAVQPARSVQKRAAVTELEATAAGARKPKPRHAFWRRANLELKIWQNLTANCTRDNRLVITNITLAYTINWTLQLVRNSQT